MQYIFPISKSPTFDHCEECGGEENEGMVGVLKTYLVITLNKDGSVFRYAEEMVCDGCADGIKSLAPKTTTPMSPRPVKRLLGSDIGLSEYAKDWPFVLEIDGERVSRACSIGWWTQDPNSDYGYVYNNDNVTFFIFEDTK